MRTYAREYEEIWNNQFSGVLSRDLHWENKTEAKKICYWAHWLTALQLETEQAIKAINSN